jgi:myo-inositol-1(or 4)-monophosphatase
MKDDVDLVTALDIEVENELKKIVRELFPTHSIVGEESEKENKDEDYVWYIDPIDGTKYFKAGMTMFTMSVGLRYK